MRVAQQDFLKMRVANFSHIFFICLILVIAVAVASVSAAPARRNVKQVNYAESGSEDNNNDPMEMEISDLDDDEIELIRSVKAYKTKPATIRKGKASSGNADQVKKPRKKASEVTARHDYGTPVNWSQFEYDPEYVHQEQQAPVKLRSDYRPAGALRRASEEEMKRNPATETGKDFVAGRWIFLNRADAEKYNTMIKNAAEVWLNSKLDSDSADRVFLKVVERNPYNLDPLALKTSPVGYPGVTFSDRRHRWKSSMTHNKVKYVIGYFIHPIDAALAYQMVLEKLNRTIRAKPVSERIHLNQAFDLDAVKNAVYETLMQIDSEIIKKVIADEAANTKPKGFFGHLADFLKF